MSYALLVLTNIAKLFLQAAPFGCATCNHHENALASKIFQTNPRLKCSELPTLYT